EDLSEPAGPLADEVGEGVRLLKLGMAGVEDQRLALVELMVEDARKAGVPAFGHARRFAAGRLLLGVVVDVEVRRLQHAEVEPLVLHLVAPEILRFQEGGDEQREAESGRRARGAEGRERHEGSCWRGRDGPEAGLPQYRGVRGIRSRAGSAQGNGETRRTRRTTARTLRYLL